MSNTPISKTQRRMLRYKMRDIRSRQRLASFKVFILDLKQKANEGNIALPEDLKKELFHLAKIAEQI